MKQSKKAMVLYYIVIFGLLGSLFYFVMTQLFNQPQRGLFPGEMNLDIGYGADVGRAMQLYIETGAKSAEEESIVTLANNGGFEKASECGKYLDYNIWSSKCSASIEKNQNELFNIALWKIIEAHPQNNRRVTVKEDFSYTPSIEKSKIKISGIGKSLDGVAQKPLKISLFIGDQKTENGLLSFPPAFHIETDFDYNQLNTIQTEMKEILKLISKSQVDAYLQSKSLNWQTHSCAPKEPEDVFFDVMDQLEQCLQSTTVCSCSLPSLELLKDRIIEIKDDSRTTEAILKDKENNLLETHTFSSNKKLKIDDRTSSGNFLDVTTIVLTSSNIIKDTTKLSTSATIAKEFILFPSEGSPACVSDPSEFRMCIPTTPEFKLAVELPKSVVTS